MTIRFLLLDDNPDDRALSRRELEKHFPDSQINEVADKAGFESQVSAGLPVDIVITDYQMRWTTGLEVVKKIKVISPQLPVIMFTATGTQEIAVEAMKSGLDDYVIKSARHYARLPVAVRTCLDRSEIRARAIRSETRLAALLNNISLGVFRMSLEGRLEESNEAFLKMLEAYPSEVADVPHPLLQRVQEVIPQLKIALDTTELQIKVGAPEDGGKFYLVKLVRVKVNGHDAIDGIVEDATSLHQANSQIIKLNQELEQRICERTKQLQEANDALEAFGFSVSHDLREPLRTIQGYANALRQDFIEGKLEKQKDYIDRIEAISFKIDLMVADLLEFARLSRAEILTETVDLISAVNEAKTTLLPNDALSKASITIDIDPELSVRAHKLTLTQALTNLISNAIKFVPVNAVPQIKVTAEMSPEGVRINVSDDGIGIAKENQQRIFNVFERLHGEEEYPGTGIGLAIVKKGVERMGGKVGVDSSPGNGSTFWVELLRA